MPPAARTTDMHVCPQVNPGPVPHVGGPILPAGCPTVLIGGLPAARAGDKAACNGPPDAIAKGSPSVITGNMMQARMGDPTSHGGLVVAGCPTVLVGETGMGKTISHNPAPAAIAFKKAARTGTALVCRGTCAACGQL